MKNIVNTYMTAQNIAEYAGNKVKQEVVAQESDVKVKIEDKVELSVGLQKFNPWENKHQGMVAFTGNNMDFAISGSGFFRVISTDDQVYYSRDGRFGVDENGFLIQRETGAMLYPPVNAGIYETMLPHPEYKRELFIKTNGEISVVHDGYYKDVYEIGKIYLYDFANVDGLKNMGNNLFRPSRESGISLEKKEFQEAGNWFNQKHVEDLTSYNNIGKVA